MKPFDIKLDRALSEMASLAGWHPTRMQAWTLYYNGQKIDNSSGRDAREAIDKYVSEEPELIRSIAQEHGVDPQRLVTGLTAKPRKYGIDYQPDQFSGADISSINSERTRKTIEQWLNDNSTPYKWIFEFGDAEFRGAKPGRADRTPGAITFTKFSNPGGDVLTPHMIMHTVGHAICQATGLDGDMAGAIREWLAATLHAPELGTGNDMAATIQFSKLLHMKAAKYTLEGSKRGFPDINEMCNELAGIYAKNGSIKIQPNEHCEFQVRQDQLAEIKSTIEAMCAVALDSLVGGHIYDD